MAKELGNTQDLVLIENIKEGTVILKDGSLRQIVMVGGINFSLKSETEQNVIIEGYQNFINSLDFHIQILIHSRKVNIEKYLDSLGALAKKEPSPILRDQASEYREFVRGFVQKNAIMEKTFLVVVPYLSIKLPTKESIGRMIPFFRSKKAKEAEEKEKEEAKLNFDTDLLQLQQRTNQVLEGLLSIGLDATVLNNDQLVQLFYNFYNPGTVEKEGINLEQNYK